jgi:D-sedoheptulose 7-phosphate isomerase
LEGALRSMESIRRYLDQVSTLLSQVDESDVAGIADLFWSCYQRGGRLVICGNGGSAATASHFVCDLQKGLACEDASSKPWEVLSLAESIPLVTAWSNDTEYANVFAAQARCWLRPGDLLLAISVSGTSPNVLSAMETARAIGATTVAWSGLGGGKLAQLADYNIVVVSRDIQQIEDVHMVLAHVVFRDLRSRKAAATVGSVPALAPT